MVLLTSGLLLVGGLRLIGVAEDQPGALKPLPKFLRTAALAEKYLNTRDVRELLEFERVEPVCRQLLMRPGVPNDVRSDALARLAELRKTTPAQQLVEILQTLDARVPAPDAAPTGEESGKPSPTQGNASPNSEKAGQELTTAAAEALAEIAPLLPQQPWEALSAEPTRGQLPTLATTAKSGVARRAGWAAWIQARQSLDEPWQAAQSQANPAALVELLESIGWLPALSPATATLPSRLMPILEGADRANTKSLVAAALRASANLPTHDTAVLHEVRKFLGQPAYAAAAVQALEGVPDATWEAEREGLRPQVAGEILESLRQMSLEMRSQEPGKRASKLVARLATGLPETQSREIQQQLARIAVQSFTLQALHEKMAYDATVLVVNPGQPLQVTFDNTDIMPHNWVLVATPAAREEIGMAADRMQTEPDALARGYLPASDQILQATRLLSPKQQQVLTFEAPAAPGAYPYVCTFPGHWSRMYGVLLVVPDREAYLAANPALPSADDLLGIRTVQWKEPELLDQLRQLTREPSRENGQRLFQRASCYSCHRMGEEGGRVGPELTRIREKYPNQEQLLRHILQPSEKIEPQYASVIAETKDGQVVRGVIVTETDDELRVRENPLDTCEPRVLRKNEIEDLSRSPVSPMPENLLNTLVTPEEVHDLLGYLLGP
jgi:putative heme-binding domain-containing protein